MMMFKGKNYFWSIEYLLNIPHNKTKEEAAMMIKDAKGYIEDCCDFFSVKKDSISKEVNEKELVKNFLDNNEI